jgi:hypothetical protein
MVRQPSTVRTTPKKRTPSKAARAAAAGTRSILTYFSPKSTPKKKSSPLNLSLEKKERTEALQSASGVSSLHIISKQNRKLVMELPFRSEARCKQHGLRKRGRELISHHPTDNRGEKSRIQASNTKINLTDSGTNSDSPSCRGIRKELGLIRISEVEESSFAEICQSLIYNIEQDSANAKTFYPLCNGAILGRDESRIKRSKRKHVTDRKYASIREKVSLGIPPKDRYISRNQSEIMNIFPPENAGQSVRNLSKIPVDCQNGCDPTLSFRCYECTIKHQWGFLRDIKCSSPYLKMRCLPDAANPFYVRKLGLKCSCVEKAKNEKELYSYETRMICQGGGAENTVFLKGEDSNNTLILTFLSI